MKSALASLCVLGLLGAAGWIYYDNQQKVAATPLIFSISFLCEDESHFIAEFKDMTTLAIIVDGKVVRTITQKDAVSYNRFEDETMIFNFVGEGVTVDDKTASTSTRCSQPFDPNNAPFNFGDGDGIEPGHDTQSVSVRGKLLGTWRSTTDEKFVRIYSEDGTVVDYYDELQTGNRGRWQVFTDENAPATVFFPLDATAIYIRHTGDGGFLHFKVIAITDQELSLIYADRGNVLTFKKEH